MVDVKDIACKTQNYSVDDISRGVFGLTSDFLISDCAG